MNTVWTKIRVAALSVAVITSLYLPTLRIPFDFVDDGNLVYPEPPMASAERARLVWAKIVANYEHLGPFRPVLWLHWEVQAELLGGDASSWRLLRLAWSALATASLLWLLHELRIPPLAAFVAAAAAMWNPWRGEIWRSLTLSEGVAMPYAVAALACAVRAGRSARAGWWDLGGSLCLLAALGCKNTFAAIVPTQMLLRIASDGEPLADAWRRHGHRAALLALPLLLPAGHLLTFLHTWHVGQYVLHLPSLRQLDRMLGSVARGASLPLLAPALVAALAALSLGQTPPDPHLLPRRRLLLVARRIWEQHRAASRAGLALLIGGVAVYLPIEGTTGRYSIPAAWGIDLWIGALLGTLSAIPASFYTRTAHALAGAGLVAIAVTNLAKQEEFAVRAAMLWEMLDFVETRTEPYSWIGWVGGPQLHIAEGIHFAWHLRGRGGSDRHLRLFDALGVPAPRPELPTSHDPLALLVTDGSPPPWPRSFEPLRRFSRPYWWGTRQHTIALWQPIEDPAFVPP
jgi:hypothetical protein